MKSKSLEIVYWLQIVIVLLAAFGILPREVISYLAFFLAVYVLKVPLEDSVVFFARSIPFFIAIPFTLHFDAFNTWRILSLIIFLRWLNWPRIKNFFDFDRKRTVFLTLVLLLVIMLASVVVAPSYSLAIKRVIFFINLSLIGIVTHDLVLKNQQLKKRIIKNLLIPVVLVSILGFVQLATTYLMDIYAFMRLWGEQINLVLFGSDWAYIVVRANTWFAYFGTQLSLRMFSIFPDSHSFPVFLLLGLPALFAVALLPVMKSSGLGLKKMFTTRGRLWAVCIPIVLLALILSGTRGIWAGAVGAAILGLLFILFLKYQRVEKEKITLFAYLSSYLWVFFLLFSIALPILASPQFLISKDNADILGNRFRSIVDAGETSNKRRLEIWRASAESMIKKPLLGVGVGNFPVVLGEHLDKAKAGSTAHNLYLHIGAEMGVVALLAAIYFLWLLLKKIYFNFLESKDNFFTLYYGAGLLFIPWMLMYSVTDAVLFDERAFLIFAITVGLIFGENKKA